jgi:hypothetical protein
VSSVFQLFCKTNPIDFDFLLVRPKVDKVDLQTKLIVSGTEAVKVSLRAEGDKEEGMSKIKFVLPCFFLKP